MNRRMINSSVDRRRVRRSNSAIIVVFIVSLILVIYMGNVVTTFSSVSKEVNLGGNLNTSTNNTQNNTQNDSQNNSKISGNVQDAKPQMQQLSDESKIATTPKNTSTPPTTAATEQNMSCLQKSIINITREEIALETKDFEYTNKMVKLSQSTGIPLRNVIISTWRSGSSFFGEILNAIPGSYYFFEPLMHFGDIQLRNQNNLVAEAIQTLYQLLKCNFTGQDDYLEHAMFHYNTRLWKFCDAFSHLDLCNDQTFLSAFCSLFPIQTVKEVRLRLAFSEPLLMDSELNIKIVLLVRDPRGIISSRKRENWCYSGEECKNSTNVCQDLISDFETAKYFTEEYPERFKVVRYEDLSLNPFKVTEEVLDFYGLPFHDDVKEFLNTHTNFDAGNSMSTFRNSKDTVFSWLHNMNFTEIDQIQSECTGAMDLWGYQKVGSEGELNNRTFNPLLQSPFDTEKEVSIGITTL